MRLLAILFAFAFGYFTNRIRSALSFLPRRTRRPGGQS